MSLDKLNTADLVAVRLLQQLEDAIAELDLYRLGPSQLAWLIGKVALWEQRSNPNSIAYSGISHTAAAVWKAVGRLLEGKLDAS